MMTKSSSSEAEEEVTEICDHPVTGSKDDEHRVDRTTEAKEDENVIPAVAGEGENEHDAEATAEASSVNDERRNTRSQTRGILTAFAGAREGLIESVVDAGDRLVYVWNRSQVSSVVESVLEQKKHLLRLLVDVRDVAPGDDCERCEKDFEEIRVLVDGLLGKARQKIQDIEHRMEAMSSRAGSVRSKRSVPPSPKSNLSDHVKLETQSLASSKSSEARKREIKEEIAALEVSLQYEKEELELKGMQRKAKLDSERIQH